MSHLSLESLARLVDEPPGPAEAEHLRACAPCRAELEALREQAAALAALPDPAPPSEGWERLAARLDAERAPTPRPWAARHPWVIRAAASIGIFLLGGVAGAAAVRAGVAPAGAARSAAAVTADPGDAGAAVAPADAAGRGTPQDAERAVRLAESRYMRALSRYAEVAPPPAGGDPVARVAALESIVLTTRAALNQAPADPVINGYHLTAIAQRDATLKQIARAGGDTWY